MFKRLSDSFWTLVSSPVKPTPDAHVHIRNAPRTAPVPRYRDERAPTRRITLDGHVRARRSMSPDQRVARWSSGHVAVGSKRKIEDVDQHSFHEQRRKTSHHNNELRSKRIPEVGYDGDEAMQDDSRTDNDYAELSESTSGGLEDVLDDNITVSQSRGNRGHRNGYLQGPVSDDDDIGEEIVVKSENSRIKREDSTIEIDGHDIRMITPRRNILDSSHRSGTSGSSSSSGRFHDGIDGETTLIVSELENARASPKRKKVISLPQAQAARGVSVPTLQAAGWDDDHIALRQKIAMRGYEPLFPAYHKFEFHWLPDELFSPDNYAFLNSLSGNNFHASKALERLFELGARVRECNMPTCTSTRSDQRSRKMIEEYAKWATTDSGLDPLTAIPLFTIVNKRAGHSATTIKLRALRKLDDLAKRYRDAFAINRSIEPATQSPSSTNTNSTLLTHPLPTLYAFVASSTIITLCAWRPGEQPAMDLRPVAVFDMALQDYDFWNALAIAIAIVHMRNMQLQIAEETGLGMKTPASARKQRRREENDPDR